jgi:hypothetical protein
MKIRLQNRQENEVIDKYFYFKWGMLKCSSYRHTQITSALYECLLEHVCECTLYFAHENKFLDTKVCSKWIEAIL